MRKFEQGCEVRVTVDARECAAFARRWPCAGHNGRGASFTFDKRSGDLVDMGADPFTDEGATLALSQDAQAYAGLRDT